MRADKIKSHAKLNLALNVTGKNSSLHKIETIIVFISLHDEILIEKINSKKHKISFTGKFSKNIGKNNTVSKLLNILDEKKLLNNKKFKVRIKKKIPSKAGLGGGSMNASNILNYFLKKKIVKITQKEVIKISKLVGSDVILGLKPTNSILNRNYKVKRFNKRKDKGQKNQFEEYFYRIKTGGDPLIKLEELINVSKTSILAIESLKSRKWVNI